MPTPTASVHAGGDGQPLAELTSVQTLAQALAPFFPCGGIESDGSNAMIGAIYVVTDDGLDHAIAIGAPLELVGIALLSGGSSPAPGV